MCDKQRSVWSISVPGANNRLSYPASMTSLWHVIKRDIQGSIHKSILQRRRISIQNVKLIGVRQWENSVIPKILESRRWTCSWQDFFLRARNPSRCTNMIHWNLSKLPSVYIIVMANVDIHAIVLTIENYENRTVTAISVKSNSVLSTVINNNSVQRTAISLVPIMPNPRITLDLFPYSNIQEYVTIMCMAQMLRIIIWRPSNGFESKPVVKIILIYDRLRHK
jgi:hypothetical protein